MKAKSSIFNQKREIKMELDHYNSKQEWKGKTWERVRLCDNAIRNTSVNFGRGIGVVQCYDNPAKRTVTVYYDKYQEASNNDTLSLCDECRKALVGSARRYGYKVK